MTNYDDSGSSPSGALSQEHRGFNQEEKQWLAWTPARRWLNFDFASELEGARLIKAKAWCRLGQGNAGCWMIFWGRGEEGWRNLVLTVFFVSSRLFTAVVRIRNLKKRKTWLFWYWRNLETNRGNLVHDSIIGEAGRDSDVHEPRENHLADRN